MLLQSKKKHKKNQEKMNKVIFKIKKTQEKTKLFSLFSILNPE